MRKQQCYPGCPDCGSRDEHFDRSICACGSMHYYCDDCGRVRDRCSLDSESAAAPPISLEVGNEQGAAAKGCFSGNNPEGLSVEAKLAEHDEFAKAAVQFLKDWLRDEPEPLLAMARGRHAEGHYRYGDKLMFEHSQDTLVAEAAQELADAICYVALLLRRAK